MYKLEIQLPEDITDDQQAASILQDLLEELISWNIHADGACFTVVPEVDNVSES